MSSTELTIRPYEDADEPHVVALWQRCGLTRPVNNPHHDIRRKLACNRELFLVGVVQQKIVAAIMGAYDGHRGAVYYVGVDPDHQRQGFGRDIMMELERRLVELGCPKFNLLVRGENQSVIEFYRRLGFIVEDNVQLGKRLIDDSPR